MSNQAKFTFVDLFAGIGGMRLPFEELGGCCVFSSEIDQSAKITYQANFNEFPQGDITLISSYDIPNHDILLAGFPCQPFSICGDQKGFSDTRGTLFFNIEKILEVKKPMAFLLENVKTLTTHDHGKTYQTITQRLLRLGYYTHTTILNALDFGLPQKRERVFIVGFHENWQFQFPRPNCKKFDLSKILEPDDDLDKKLFASEQIRQNRLNKVKNKIFYPSIWHENKGGNISILPYSCALRANASYNYLLVNGIRRLSAREMLRLQGFPDHFKIVVPLSEIRKQAGNTVAIPVVKAIAEEMLITLNRKELLLI